MSETPAVYKAQAARDLGIKIKKHFSELNQEQIEEQVLKIYYGCDKEGTQTGRYIFPPGLDPIIVYGSPIEMTCIEDGRKYITTIGELVETICRQFALNFTGLNKDE